MIDISITLTSAEASHVKLACKWVASQVSNGQLNLVNPKNTPRDAASMDNAQFVADLMNAASKIQAEWEKQ